MHQPDDYDEEESDYESDDFEEDDEDAVSATRTASSDEIYIPATKKVVHVNAHNFPAPSPSEIFPGTSNLPNHVFLNTLK